MFARQLYQKVCLQSHLTVLEVSPDPGAPDVLVVENEIIVAKKNLYKHFALAHTSLQQRLLRTETDAVSDPEDDYYALLLYLLTTNENHTVLRLHETDFWRVYYSRSGEHQRQWLRNEFRFILGVLNSRSSRINKSSSLWFWMKKLSIMCIFSKLSTANGDDQVFADLDMLVECITSSSKLHFANYYCHGFIKWTVSVSLRVSIVSGSIDARILNLYNLVKQLAMSHLRDVSLWTTLRVLLRLLSGHRETQLHQFVCEEYNMLLQQLSTHTQLSPENTAHPSLLELETELTHLKLYLDSVQCGYKTPYAVLQDIDQ